MDAEGPLAKSIAAWELRGMSWPELSTSRPFAELVFHVLAHVESSVPASLFSPGYIAYAARHLGPSSSRALSEDAGWLRSFAQDSERYARLQSLAWLFDDCARATQVAHRDLRTLGPEDVADPRALRALSELGPEVELLRCAVELERESFERLPRPTWPREALAQALRDLTPAAPTLPEHGICTLRSLGFRGRVRDREIWIGEPFPEGPTPEHLAFQAAHEATVSELLEWRVAERERERAAIVLFAARARRVGLTREHQRWLAHFGPNAPSTESAHLPEPLRVQLLSLLC